MVLQSIRRDRIWSKQWKMSIFRLRPSSLHPVFPEDSGSAKRWSYRNRSVRVWRWRPLSVHQDRFLLKSRYLQKPFLHFFWFDPVFISGKIFSVSFPSFSNSSTAVHIFVLPPLLSNTWLMNSCDSVIAPITRSVSQSWFWYIFQNTYYWLSVIQNSAI